MTPVPRSSLSPALRFLIAGACLVIIVQGLREAAAVINPLLLVMLLVPTVDPLQQWLIRRGIRHGTATAITLVALVLLTVGVVVFVGTSVAGLAARLPEYEPRLVALRESIFGMLRSRGIDTGQIQAANILDPSRLLGIATGVLGAVAGALSSTLIVILLVAFVLPLLTRRETADLLLQDEQESGGFSDYLPAVRKYVSITSIVGAANAAIIAVLLLALGIDFALTWALLFFLLNFVPAVGFIISMAPPVLLALLEFGWGRALVVAVVYIVSNFVSDNMIKPRFMAQGLDMSPLLVIVALLFWSWVLGPIGAIVAVPLTMVIRRAASEFGIERPTAAGI